MRNNKAPVMLKAAVTASYLKITVKTKPSFSKRVTNVWSASGVPVSHQASA